MSGPTPIRDVLPLLEELEAYDTHSATHTWRVTLYARAVAEAAGIDMDRIARISVFLRVCSDGTNSIGLAGRKPPAWVFQS